MSLKPPPPLWEKKPHKYQKPSTEIFLARLGLGARIGLDLLGQLLDSAEWHAQNRREKRKERWRDSCADFSSNLRRSIPLYSVNDAAMRSVILEDELPRNSYQIMQPHDLQNFISRELSRREHNRDVIVERIYCTGIGECGPSWFRWLVKAACFGPLLRWLIMRQASRYFRTSVYQHIHDPPRVPWPLRIAFR